MTPKERRALSALRIDWATTREDVWGPTPGHVSALHIGAAREVHNGVRDAADSGGPSPLGLVIQGQHGTGKTHLLHWTRDKVQGEGGCFFIVELLDGRSVWDSVVEAMLNGLQRPAPGGGTQLSTFLRDLLPAGKMSKRRLDGLLQGIRGLDGQAAIECRDTARALALYSEDGTQELGWRYLLSIDGVEPRDLAKWDLKLPRTEPWRTVRDVSWLLSLTGPIVIAVDQIDTLIAQSNLATPAFGRGGREDELVAQVADGLMRLRERTRRTLTVLACLPKSWKLIEAKAVGSVPDRFRVTPPLGTISDPRIGVDIVTQRFSARFGAIGFQAPYPTWPVLPSAFDPTGYTPRWLLRQIDGHVRRCLATGEVTPLDSLVDAPEGPVEVTLAPTDLAILDARFASLRSTADSLNALDPALEDSLVPGLLAAGLDAWIKERAGDGRAFERDITPSVKPLPALHARLALVLDEATEDQVHWAFRAIGSANPIAARNRLHSARTKAGCNPDVPKRKLFLLRNVPWPNGPGARREFDAFVADGGHCLPLVADDLRTFAALAQMLNENDPELPAWLAARRPASGTELLRTALAEAPIVADDQRGRDDEAAIQLASATSEDPPVPLDLSSLRRHVVIFAGSGSGKTNLLRRLVEECALRGVSSIVLDGHNDLACLGDAWPQPPPAWGAADAVTASAYLAGTEVVIWTPGRSLGRPLSFQPLPDFQSVMDDADEFKAAINGAVAVLAPRAYVGGMTRRDGDGQAVLREALTYFARQAGRDLPEYIGLLADLPPGVSTVDDSGKVAAGLARALRASIVNDPVFAGTGQAVDPGLLLTPGAGKRARVSVISFIGLPDDAQRQSFVNQLQMALFAWIKNHPAGDRPLSGLFVMDEAQTYAPSNGMTPCTRSTLSLAAQARKYGLGLVFATQGPKGIHNQIPLNASTQFLGQMNSGATINAAKEIARSRGSDVSDIGRLRKGEFYLSVEGSRFRKVRVPMGLSHHPPRPLTVEEVIERARVRR